MAQAEPHILAAGMSRNAARAAGLSPFPGQVEPRPDKWRQDHKPSARDGTAPRGSGPPGSACWWQDMWRSPARRGNPRLTAPCGRTLNAPRPERLPGLPGAL